MDEELSTVNAEFQKKIAELTELTNNMDNLLVSTEVHALFLDNNLCIRKFTPKMAEVFHLMPHDIGRRMGAFVHNIVCDDLTAKISRVLETGKQYEQRVQDNREHHFLMRVLASERTSGVVLTLIEISSLVAAQTDLLRERERFERVVAANRDGIWDWPDVKQDEMWWSPSCYQLLGYEPDEFPPRYSEWLHLIHPEDRELVRQTSVPTQSKCYVKLHGDFEYLLAKTLGMQGCDVAEAGDGQSALGLFRSFRPDVAVIDIGLPSMNGYQLARAVRGIDQLPKITLVALTGYARESDRLAAAEAGFDAHLVKPLNPVKLYELIAEKHAEHEAIS